MTSVTGAAEAVIRKGFTPAIPFPLTHKQDDICAWGRLFDVAVPGGGIGRGGVLRLPVKQDCRDRVVSVACRGRAVLVRFLQRDEKEIRPRRLVSQVSAMRKDQHATLFSAFVGGLNLSKGKAGCPVEFGLPVCILEDKHGFELHHEVMWQGSDVDLAVPMVAAAQERFPDLRAVSFDRGARNPENRVRLDEMLDLNVLPKKGYLGRADRERETGDAFVAMRRAHPAVEYAINNLGHRGAGRVRSRGPAGFARAVALSVVAMNIHRIGLLLRRQSQATARRADGLAA